MKKILLFCSLMFFMIIQETKAISPTIATNNMKEQQEILNKKRNTISNNGFVILNKEERINEILENNKIPKFYLVNLSSLNTIEDSIEYLRKKFNKYNVEILYIEVIPFY